MTNAGETLDNLSKIFVRKNAATIRKDMKIAFTGLARAGYVHKDIYARNIAYNSSRKSFVLIDFDKMGTLGKSNVKGAVEQSMQTLDRNVF